MWEGRGEGRGRAGGDVGGEGRGERRGERGGLEELASGVPGGGKGGLGREGWRPEGWREAKPVGRREEVGSKVEEAMLWNELNSSAMASGRSTSMPVSLLFGASGRLASSPGEVGRGRPEGVVAVELSWPAGNGVQDGVGCELVPAV